MDVYMIIKNLQSIFKENMTQENIMHFATGGEQ